MKWLSNPKQWLEMRRTSDGPAFLSAEDWEADEQAISSAKTVSHAYVNYNGILPDGDEFC